MNNKIDMEVKSNVKDSLDTMILKIVDDSVTYSIKVNPYLPVSQILYKINQKYPEQHHTTTSMFFRDIEMEPDKFLITYFRNWSNNNIYPIHTVYLRSGVNITKNYNQHDEFLLQSDFIHSEMSQFTHKLMIGGYLLFLGISTTVLQVIL